MSNTNCWLGRTALLFILAASAVTSGAGVLVVLKSWSEANAHTGRITLLAQLEGQGINRLNALLIAHAGWVSVLLLLVMLLSLYCLVLAIQRSVSTPRLVLSRGSLGEVAIQADQIGKLAQREAEHVSGVREVQTSTRSSETGTAISQKVVVEPEMVFVTLAEQVQQRVKKSLEYHLGLPVKSVQVTLQHVPITKKVI